MMKVLLDTNVLIDYIAMREPYFDDARSIMFACSNGKLDGCIAAHSVCNIFYILRNQMPGTVRRSTLRRICEVFTVVGIDRTTLLAALSREDFRDFEDCLQAECAAEFSVDFIITRNFKDFAESRIPAVSPPEFLARMQNS